MTPVETIELLVADGIIDALIQRVKTGKEAEVFVVRKGEHFLAAKVYKERKARNFKNNATYREGRAVRNTRDQRAMTKGSKYGLAKSEADWMHTEHDALITVGAAGVRVPKPELYYEGVLLMELVLGSDGQPAPRLIEVPFTEEEAVACFKEIVSHIVGMLTCDLIHGDLSPYNILMAWNGPTIIDMPQVVKAAHNSQAEEFLVRDFRNIADHFSKFAPQLKKRIHDGEAIWNKYTRRELARDYFPDEAESAAAFAGHREGKRATVLQPPEPRRSDRPDRPERKGGNDRPPRPLREDGAHHSAPGASPRPSGAPRPPPGAPRPSPGAPRPPGPPRPPAHAPAAAHSAPHPPAAHSAPHHPRPPRPTPPAAPPSAAAPPPPANRAQQGHWQERPPRPPPHPDGNRAAHPPRPNGGPRRPAPPRPPPGPVIQRVVRLAPPTAGHTPAGAPHKDSPGGDARPGRFSMHHRNRQS